MNTLEIVCESCDRRMRLSPNLLQKIAGKRGRVTCTRCENKIIVDGRGEEIVVKAGGYEAFDLEEVASSDSAGPHLSEFPASADEAERTQAERSARIVSLPPPFPQEARRDRLRLKASVRRLGELARAAQKAGPGMEFVAPEPELFRGNEDSLSPHAMNNEPHSFTSQSHGFTSQSHGADRDRQVVDDEEEGLASLKQEFNSSPFASERDETYRSLYPRPQPRKAGHSTGPAPVLSRAPAPPRAGELRRGQSQPEIFRDELGTAPAIATTIVEQGPDGQLINQADKKRLASTEGSSKQWVPWALAAATLLALGISISLNRGPRVIVEAPPAHAALAPALPVSVMPDERALPVPEEAETEGSDSEHSQSADLSQPPKRDVSAAPTQLAAAPPSKKAEKSDVQVTGAEIATADPEAASPQPAVEEPAPDLPPFSSASASVALRESTALAAACRRSDDPTGYAQVTVTFAPSGRVTRATVSGPPFAGTQTGGCIASRFREARVPAFSGDHVSVTKSVTIR